MPIQFNPNPIIQYSVSGLKIGLMKFLELGESLLKSDLFSVGMRHQNIRINGEYNFSGKMDQEAKDAILSIPEGSMFQQLQLDFMNVQQARVIVVYQPGNALLQLQCQRISAADILQPIKDIVQGWIDSLRLVVSVVDDGGNPPNSSVLSGGLRSDLIIDAYRLVQRLGSGHSAEVWEAEVVRTPQGINLNPGDRVAIKLYSIVDNHGNESLRVQREFRVASSINHRNLVRVYDVMLSPSRPFHNFLVMELIDGRTLKSAIPRDGMDVDRVIGIGVDIVSALEALHQREALHRDIKAANVLMRNSNGRDEAVLCDLGIVSVIEDSSLTGTSVFMGSKHSAPFEQLIGEEIDKRTDIYAVGAVLFNCYVGNPMYNRVGTQGAIVARMMRNPEVLSVKRGSSNRREIALVGVINECIAFDPAKRPATARDLLRKLQGLLNV